MPEDTLTLALNGRVTLEAYNTAIRAFTGLVQALHAEITPGTRTVWEIDDLQISSAIATVRAASGDPTDIERITRAFTGVGRALSRNEPIPFAPRVREPAKLLTSIINDTLTSIRFETASDDVTILSPTIPAPRLPGTEDLGSFGAITGRIQTVSNRIGVRFTLYDSIFDRAVSCYLTDNSQELIRGLWGTRVAVHGLIRRDPTSGRPVVVRHISDIQPIVPDEPNRFSYLTARGVIPARSEDQRPEDVLRRLRDAR